MNHRPFHVRNMLLGYDRQLTTARRLARFRRALRAQAAEDEVSISRDVRRREMVERVSREVIENLLISGSENPIVREVMDDIRKEFGDDLHFTYPPDTLELALYRSGKEGPKEVPPDEKSKIFGRLWQITLDKVDATML